MFVVSHVNLLHYSCPHLSQKWLLMRFISSVDVVLEEYNNCLPNNKWLGVKHVSIVFWLAFVTGALLTIS